MPNLLAKRPAGSSEARTIERKSVAVAAAGHCLAVGGLSAIHSDYPGFGVSVFAAEMDGSPAGFGACSFLRLVGLSFAEAMPAVEAGRRGRFDDGRFAGSETA